MLYYDKWSELNQDITIMNVGDMQIFNDGRTIILRLVDKYASLLREYRRIMDVVSKIE